MKDEKKKFIIPDAEIIEFSNNDIITLSDGTGNTDWGEDDNVEPFNV